MTGFIEDHLDAEDKIYTVLLNVLSDSIPDVIVGLPKIFWQGVSDADDDPSPPVDDFWLRVALRFDTAGQATLSGDHTREKMWDRTGTLAVQFFNPIKDPTLLRTCKRLAILAQRAYESGGSAPEIIFRDVRIDPVGPSESWYQTNLTATFEYSEFH